MRPRNLTDVASSVVKGMSRSINRSAQPTEDQTREGRRKGSRRGATLVDGKSPMDYLKMLEELQGFPEEREIIASGDEDAAEEYLKKDAQLNNQSYEEAVRSIAEEYGDDSYLGGRNGSRKGSRKGATREEVIDEIFDGDEILYNEYLDEMGEYGLANWSIDTWKEYFEKYEMGLDPEGEDKFLEAHRNG